MAAVRELHGAIGDPDAALTVVYASPDHDLEVLGRALHDAFGDGPVIGCTTAGEITPTGYASGAITGVSIRGPGFGAASVRVDGLRDFSIARGSEVVDAAVARFGRRPRPEDSFGFLLADGLSMQEEGLVAALYRDLGDTPLFGGSAGDGTRFRRTAVYHEGRFRTDAAVFTLVRCDHPFAVFKTEHFEAADEKMVITAADPSRRIVTEINGVPAGREYARIVGLAPEDLTPLSFATRPVVVRVGDAVFVRSIQKVNEDGSLTFFCAIDEGIVLTVGRPLDLVENLAGAFADVRKKVGDPVLILGCDCVLRDVEAQRRGLRGPIGELMARNAVVGFATYGEQFNGMHVNQTFTGVAIGHG